LVSTGTLDTLHVHAREVFRAAIIAAAHSIVLVHNHPSGDPSPSEADIRVTQELARAGQLLKLELLDHLVIGHDTHASLREMGYLVR
jgi:DNA repair protein RadC